MELREKNVIKIKISIKIFKREREKMIKSILNNRLNKIDININAKSLFLHHQRNTWISIYTYKNYAYNYVN